MGAVEALTASSSVTAAAVIGVTDAPPFFLSSGVCVSAAWTLIRRAGVDGGSLDGVAPPASSHAIMGAGFGEASPELSSLPIAVVSAPTMTRRGVAAALGTASALAGASVSPRSSCSVKGTTVKGSWRCGTGSGLGDCAACRVRSFRSHCRAQVETGEEEME